LPVGILQDLQDPKLRIGILESPLILENDQIISLVSQDSYNKSKNNQIPINIPELYQTLNAGDRILMNDGNIHLKIQKMEKDAITAFVINGGKLSSQQGINLPGVTLGIPALTEKDRVDLAFGLSMGVDAVAISFVRTADDVNIVRRIIQEYSKSNQQLLIAKLEKPEALGNLTEIIEAADGVMVARGDLGVEMDLEDVPVAQKQIIHSANKMNKLVITATQMLESMIHEPTPTRAEASDVANAIFDGSDMVMLSGETAIGKFPVETVSIMDRIIRQSEAAYREWGFIQEQPGSGFQEETAIVRAARELSHARDVAAIAVFTFSGQSAYLMAKMRPQVPIMAFTPDEKVFQRLSFPWGVYPQQVSLVSSVEEMIKCVEIELISSGLVIPGQQVVLIFGYPLGARVIPNMALLHKIGTG